MCFAFPLVWGENEDSTHPSIVSGGSGEPDNETKHTKQQQQKRFYHLSIPIWEFEPTPKVTSLDLKQFIFTT